MKKREDIFTVGIFFIITILIIIIICKIPTKTINDTTENNKITTTTENKLEKETSDIVTGKIVEKTNLYNTSYITIETDEGIKVPIYESFSNYSRGLKINDKVSFEVSKVEGSGYKIVGINLN